MRESKISGKEFLHSKWVVTDKLQCPTYDPEQLFIS